MKTVSKGFMLIEVMIYSLVLVIVVVAVMTYAASFQVTIRDHIRLGNACARVSGVWDVLARDMQQAPVNKELWKACSDAWCIWPSPQGDIGWQNSSAGIVRWQGSYNIKTNQWSSHRKYCIAPGMRYELQRTMRNEYTIGSVTIMLQEPTGENMSGIVALRVGALA